MRIGIDGLPLTQPLTGIGHYTLELARHLARNSSTDQIEVVSPKPFRQSLTSDQNESEQLRWIHSRVNFLTGRWWSIGLPRYILRHGLEIFHGTNFEIPLQRVCPAVLTIHDLSLLLYPDTHPRRRVWRARQRLPLMARRATMIIADSDAVRSEIHQHLKTSLERIVTIHLAPRDVFRRMDPQRANDIRGRLGIGENFVLYAGTIEARKNLAVLVQAFEKFCVSYKIDAQLVLAGKRGWLVDPLYKTVRKLSIRHNVIFTEYLSDEQLCALYSSCRAFVYPSLYEGFGLPPLEAMASGAPVIAADIPSLREVLGDAALLVPPESSTELAQAVHDVWEDDELRNRLIRSGQKRAAEFSWSRTAQSTRTVYDEAVDRFSRGPTYSQE